jgi:excisionase family DNA binding protein
MTTTVTPFRGQRIVPAKWCWSEPRDDTILEATVPVTTPSGGLPATAAPAPAQNRPAAAELLTVNQVATAMQVSKMTVYRLIHAGTLGAVRVGQSLRLPRASVEAFLRAEPDQPGRPSAT